MLDQLKIDVFNANLKLVKHNLVKFTWGNVSGIDESKKFVVIKPSGVDYSTMTAEDMVVVQLDDGRIVDGKRKPSSDTPTHLELYRNFSEIGGVVHTHSQWATIFAQAGRNIPPLGTTHADYFSHAIPCTRALTEKEVNGFYERDTGKVIVETFKNSSPKELPGVLVRNHGPFAWGKDAYNAVYHAAVLEELAMMAWHTLILDADVDNMPDFLLEKHYYRKHGASAYYGQ